MDKQSSIWIHGLSGKMGQEVQVCTNAHKSVYFAGGSSRVLQYDGKLGLEKTNKDTLASALSEISPSILIDFSTISGNQLLLDSLQTYTKPLAVVVGTTGLEASTVSNWRSLVKKRPHIHLLIAPNTSIGVALTLKAALSVAGILVENDFDIEIVESHHRRKVDAPSGTAKYLAEGVAKGVGGLELTTDHQGKRKPHTIGIHAIRGGGIYGEHEIRFISEDEELKISHRSFGRKLFANGALNLGLWLMKKEAGAYGLEDVGN